MFCKNCGKPIDDDANYCAHCGAAIKNDSANNLPPNEQSEIKSVSKPTTPPQKESNNNTSEGRGGCLFVILIILIIAIVFVSIGISSSGGCKSCVVANKDGNGDYKPQLLSRAATNNDISVNYNYEGIVTINIDVTAKSDIKDLALTLKFTNDKSVVLKTFDKYVGDINKDETHRISIGITELGLSEIITIKYVQITVSGGSVSYFA